jgi:hypothetical protein
MANHYVFAYGSLMNAESRASTGRSGVAIPARVEGFQRSWNVGDQAARLTFLGVVQQEESATNGVLVSASAAELLRFDRRETGYTRINVDSARIVSFRGEQIPQEPIWIYLPDKPARPSTDCPIAQSYVDVVLAGCLEVGESFAAEFVRSTTNWHGPWVDDRAAPRYARAQRTPATDFAELDRILGEMVVRRRKSLQDKQ